MATVNVDVREVFTEALAISAARAREGTRRRNFNEKMMVRAAENVYAAHLVEAVRPNGYTPSEGGIRGRELVEEHAARGIPLSAKGYAILLGYSEAYISRLYRLGFGLACGVLDPNEKSEGGPTLWQMLSRNVGDSPEVGEVLGKDAKEVPTLDKIEDAVRRAAERRAQEAEDRRDAAAQESTWIPTAPSERLARLEELADSLKHGRHLTPHQIDRVRLVMDELRGFIEQWMSESMKVAS